MHRISQTTLVLLGAGLTLPVSAARAQQAQPASPSKPAQSGQAPAAADQNTDESDEEIVVTGKPPRGSAIGNIPPENTLHARDVKATGATNVDQLLDTIAPQVGIARGGGGRPLVLLNGRRVSSYRELRDIPIEAISRLDVLPEEVALKYGVRPDQKVVNVVLREHFRSTNAQLAGNVASSKGFTGGNGDLTRIDIGKRGRTTYNLHAGGDDILSGSQRALVGQQSDTSASNGSGPLLPSELRVRGGVTMNRDLAGNAAGTLNVEAQHNQGHSLSGLSEILPAELNRKSTSDSVHVGGVVSGNEQASWRWTVTGNSEAEQDVTKTKNSGAVLASGNNRSTRLAADVDATVTGDLLQLPAGKVGTTFRVGGTAEQLDIDQHRVGSLPRETTSRTAAIGAASIDVPVARRGRALGALGNLTLNGNAEVDRLSDFGTLTRLGAGANWSPLDRVNLIASWTDEENAPSVRQLGNPFLETPQMRIFDFTNRIVTRADILTGGNPALRVERQHTVKLSANWQPLVDTDFRLRADFAHEILDRPISPITVLPAFETAFPDRFVRNAAGQLISVDLRPVNLASARRDTLRVGFDFSKPLKSRKVSQAEVQKLIDKARASGIAVPEAPTSPTAPPSPIAQAASNGRLTFSLTDTIATVDRATIGPGLPALDYLHGAAIGQTGGEPRHQVQAQAGWANNGVGARLGFNWRSATRVETLTGEPLRFSPVATFDLRTFANVGQDLALVAHHPWLAGSSIRFEVGNILNKRPKVHDAAGNTPLGYVPTMLDPLGRTVMISLRKQFLPKSFYREQLQKFEQRQQQAPQQP